MTLCHYTCVICGRVLEYAGPLPELYPFCSARCKLIDLGRWFSEQYTIDTDLPPEMLEPPREPDIPPPPEPPQT